jgi:lambda family phage portal protein
MAAKRIRSQIAVEMMDSHQRNFEGAGRGRRFNNWGYSTSSQNQQIAASLPVLRERSRDLSRNFGFSKNAIRKIGNNVVGTGILATPISPTGNKKEVKETKAIWKGWADSTDCDFDGMQNFYGIQKMVVKTAAKSGSCFVRRVWKKYKKGTISLELQVLEPDFLDKSKTGVTYDNGEYTFQGIQFDKFGKRKAYWLFERHPNDFKGESKPVPVEDIAHIYDLEDPGQVDGLPFNSSVILETKDFGEYRDAQLIRQKIAACFAVFIQDSDAGLPGSGGGSQTDMLEKVEPGIIEHLPPGKTMQFANPPTTDGFGDYSRQSFLGQAAGMGLSYESYTGDLSNVNFSSGRMGWIDANRNVEDLQWNMAIPMLCDKVWKWFIQAAYLAGLVKSKDIKVLWTPPRREMIDPVKETQAMVKQIRAGLISWQDAVRQLGYTPEEIMEQLKEDAENFDKAKLMPESDPRFDPVRKNAEIALKKKSEKVNAVE